MPCRSAVMRQQELQGPRPATLKVADDSRMAKKRRPAAHQERQPVIIYVESPKVVHADPSEFKAVVQRLTGAPLPAAAASSLSSSFEFSPSLSLLSPAALQRPAATDTMRQFPFQLYGGQQQGLAVGDDDLMLLSLLAGGDAAAGRSERGLGGCVVSNKDHQPSPALLSPFHDEHGRYSYMAPPAAAAACCSIQPTNLLLSAIAPPLPLGLGDLFITHQ